MKKISLFFYFLLIFLSLIILSIGSVFFFSVKTYSESIYSELENSLIQQGFIIHNELPLSGSDSDYLEMVNRISKQVNAQITIIGINGKVYADSHRDSMTMENHADRPEVIKALSGTIGVSKRLSSTLSENMLYVSIPPSKKSIIVRMALSVDYIGKKISRTLREVLLFSLIILLVTVIISIVSARKFSQVIEGIKDITTHYSTGDFTLKLKENGPLEVYQLNKSINVMGDRLRNIIDKTSFQNNELQAMVNSMIESVILLDSNLKIRKMNSAAESLTGKLLSQSQGKTLDSVLKNSLIKKLIEESFSNSEISQDTICLDRPLEQYVQIHCCPIRNSENANAGFLLVINDITHIKKLENTRKEFVSNVSHELKTPITLINGYVGTLLDGAITERDKILHFLSVIDKHSRRLSSIIEDLLTLSNIEDKGADIQKETINLYDLLFSAYTSALDSATEENISIKIVCFEKLRVQANPNLLEQAILNLVNNAVKYAGKGSSIIISGRQTAVKREKKIEIVVEDDGVGIDPEQVDRIFERFYRIDKKQSRNAGGTGLGLSIVRHIILAHKGKISVSSELGRGAKFTITLPAHTF